MFFPGGRFQPELIYDSIFLTFQFGVEGETKPQQYFSDTGVLSKRKNPQVCILANIVSQTSKSK